MLTLSKTLSSLQHDATSLSLKLLQNLLSSHADEMSRLRNELDSAKAELAQKATASQVVSPQHSVEPPSTPLAIVSTPVLAPYSVSFDSSGSSVIIPLDSPLISPSVDDLPCPLSLLKRKRSFSDLGPINSSRVSAPSTKYSRTDLQRLQQYWGKQK
ncbi:hypothetical protein RCL1_007525 [Eukaryota sp. TZLM3-RCL]